METSAPLAAVAVLVAATVIPACGGSSTTSTNAQGTEDGQCYADGTCDTGLVCSSNRCVNPGAGGSGTSTGSAGAGGSASGSPAGPSFAKYSAPGITSRGETYSNNGVLTSATYHFFVENTGGSGTATVNVSYQGYTETKQFTVEGGAQYVLSSLFPMTNAGEVARTRPCTLSVELPGLTVDQDMTENTSPLPSSDSFTCAKVAGESTSDLIPLSSCTCSGGCPGYMAVQPCPNNCGLIDPLCCGGCPAGRTCAGGSCTANN
jgi:hypothetical protein